MSETPDLRVTFYITPIDPSTQIRTHIESLPDGSIARFAITLECLHEGKWYAVVRYDNTGGKVHRDRLLPNGDKLTHRESVHMGLDLHLAVTAARRELAEHCEQYLREFFTYL